MPRAGAGPAFFGNGTGATVATLTTFSQSGAVIFSTTRTGFGEDVSTFIGLESAAADIAAVHLDHGDTLLGEELDDLLFER